MKKRLCLSMIIGLLFVLTTSISAFANGEPFPWCTDTPEYCQEKIAQVPIPWQFWGIVTDAAVNTTVIDRIRLSPTWLNPLPNQSVIMSSPPVFIKRQYAVSQNPLPIPLDGLVWDFLGGMPNIDLEWIVVDEVPQEIYPGGADLMLEIPVTASDRAVLVAYEVLIDLVNNLEGEVVPVPIGHFINEAVLEWPNETIVALESDQAPTIVEIMVNFDIHNSTGLDVDNFELDFFGLDFECVDIQGAIGFIAAQGLSPVPISPVIWGANPENLLVVRPITEDTTEVKWIQPDRPLQTCEWLHVGLQFKCTDFDCFNNPDDTNLRATVQGYWTVTEPCPGVPVDIKPMSCPNPLGLKDRGVLPVAILGTENLDVTQIDPASVRLEGADGSVSPLRWALEDVETPFEPYLGKEDCTEDCHAIGSDGYTDLTLKFDAQEVVTALGEVQDGDCVVVMLTGAFKEEFGGTAFTGEDVVVIVKK